MNYLCLLSVEIRDMELYPSTVFIRNLIHKSSPPLKVSFIPFLIYLSVCLLIGEQWTTCENKFSSHHVGPRDRTQVVRGLAIKSQPTQAPQIKF